MNIKKIKFIFRKMFPYLCVVHHLFFFLVFFWMWGYIVTEPAFSEFLFCNYDFGSNPAIMFGAFMTMFAVLTVLFGIRLIAFVFWLFKKVKTNAPKA